MSTILSVSAAGFIPYEVEVGRGLLAGLGAQVAALTKGRVVVIATRPWLHSTVRWRWRRWKPSD